MVDPFRPPLSRRRHQLSLALRRHLRSVSSQRSGSMPVPAGYLRGSTAAAFGSSASLIPPPPINTQQPGVVTSLLYSGSKFRGYQKSKGNSYDVEVVLQVGVWGGYLTIKGSCHASLVICQMHARMIDSWEISGSRPAVSSLQS